MAHHCWAACVMVLGVFAVAAASVELPSGPIAPTAAPITFTDAAALASVAEGGPEAVNPTRVLPVQAIRSTRIPVRLSSRRPVPEDIPSGVDTAAWAHAAQCAASSCSPRAFAAAAAPLSPCRRPGAGWAAALILKDAC
jgi:hypothetical protein